MFEFNPFGYVNEGTSRKYCAVQSREFVVSRGNDFSKPGTEDIFMVFQAFRGVDEDDALSAEFLLHVGVGGFGVVLGFHARQKLAFLFRNAQAFEGALYILRHVVPASFGPFSVGEVVADLGEVYFLISGEAQWVGMGLLSKTASAFLRNWRTHSGSSLTSQM